MTESALPRIFFTLLIFTVFNFTGSTFAQTAGSELALKQALASGKPTFLEFEAPWCPSCALMRPVVAAITKDFSGKLNVISVNVDTDENLVNMFKIRSIPVQILLDGSGKEVKRHFGPTSRSELVRQLKGSFRF